MQVCLVGGHPVPLASQSLTETTALLLAALFLTFSKQLSQIGLLNLKKHVQFLLHFLHDSSSNEIVYAS